MSFKNDLFHQELPDMSSHKVNYEPVQSIVSNSNPNRLHQVGSSLPLTAPPVRANPPQIAYYPNPIRQPSSLSPQPTVIRPMHTMQQTSVQLLQRPVVHRPNPPSIAPPQNMMVPPHIVSGAQFRPQLQASGSQQGFPIHIRPPAHIMNSTGGRVQPQASFSPQPRTITPAAPILNINAARPQPGPSVVGNSYQNLTQVKPAERPQNIRA